MPPGGGTKETSATAPKRETFRPPWVKDATSVKPPVTPAKDSTPTKPATREPKSVAKEPTKDPAPAWMQHKLRPVQPKVTDETKNSPPKEEEKPVANDKPKAALKKQTTIREKVDVKQNGVDCKENSKPPTQAPEKSPSKGRIPAKDEKLPPKKPALTKQISREDMPLKKWRDPLHERVKENIDKTLANEVPKGHTLTKNESLRSLLKPTPPPMPPPLPPKCPPPPEFKKSEITAEKLKKLESLKSRPRRRPDWSDMMKEVESGRKLKKVVCNDRSSPVITAASVVKTKGEFIFESEKEGKHNELLKEINMGVKLKKTKTNDRSKPNLDGLRKFRRQMTIEEQLQKSMSQANLANVAEDVPADEEEIDEMDDIDKVRDDLQSTKQLLALELRNKEAQLRESKRLQTRIQNLESELARERAIVKQERAKTVVSVTDAYDERLVHQLKDEVENAKGAADDLERKYLRAAEERDEAQSELEEARRRNAELEKKLQQALVKTSDKVYEQEEPLSFFVKRQLEYEKECRLLNMETSADSHFVPITSSAAKYDDQGIMPSNPNSRRSSHAIKQLSVQRDSSFEEEDEISDEEEEESEEKKQKRMEREVKNFRNKIRHLKEKKDRATKERAALKVMLKNQQYALKEEKKKYKQLKRDVDKMAAMMKEVGSDEEEDEEEEEEEEEEKNESSEDEETETETEQETESDTESESEPEDAPILKKKENLSSRTKRYESSLTALKKGNCLLMANVDRLKDDVTKQREESSSLQKELDSLLEEL